MFDSEFIANPYKFYSRLRTAPIHWAEKFRTGAWLIPRYQDDIANFFGNANATPDIARRAQKSLVDMTEYFRNVLPERRKHKGDDLVSLLLRVEEEGDVLTEEDLLAQCALLLIAGHETTRNLIGNGLLALLQNRDQFEKLKQNPSLTSSAVKEFARYDSPVQFAGRSALEDFSWHDQQIKKGQTVILLLGSANHDPDKFSNPDSLEITRNEGMSMSFGQGIHFCIGQALGYMEAEIAFTSLLERIPNLKMVDEKPDRRPNPAFRGLNSLRLTF
jgi:cytochrome P450